jgi:hypothetical protein
MCTPSYANEAWHLSGSHYGRQACRRPTEDKSNYYLLRTCHHIHYTLCTPSNAANACNLNSATTANDGSNR